MASELDTNVRFVEFSVTVLVVVTFVFSSEAIGIGD